jgi:hypothetical protein
MATIYRLATEYHLKRELYDTLYDLADLALDLLA